MTTYIVQQTQSDGTITQSKCSAESYPHTFRLADMLEQSALLSYPMSARALEYVGSAEHGEWDLVTLFPSFGDTDDFIQLTDEEQEDQTNTMLNMLTDVIYDFLLSSKIGDEEDCKSGIDHPIIIIKT